jgi:hypothetical protein
MRDFAVLAHQATAYSHATLENWDYFAPLVFVHDHESLDEETKVRLYHMVDSASAALAYAHCLNAQMNVLPSRLHRKYEQERVPKPADTVETPARWPSLTSWVKGTQAQIADDHCHAVGELRHEDIWLGRRSRASVNPKVRLAGFDSSRGGRGARRRKTVSAGVHSATD